MFGVFVYFGSFGGAPGSPRRRTIWMIALTVQGVVWRLGTLSLGCGRLVVGAEGGAAPPVRVPQGPAGEALAARQGGGAPVAAAALRPAAREEVVELVHL